MRYRSVSVGNSETIIWYEADLDTKHGKDEAKAEQGQAIQMYGQESRQSGDII